MKKSKKIDNIKIKKKAKDSINKKFILNMFLLFLFVFLFFISLLLIFINTREMKETDNQLLKNIYKINNNLLKKEDIIAIVNGEPIKKIEVSNRYESLPDMYKNLLSFENVLNQVIEEKLLLQESKKEKIVVSDDEIKRGIELLFIQNQLTNEDLLLLLKEKNLSYEEFKSLYSNQLAISKLLNKTILSSININENDLLNYYKNNIDLFIIPTSINVSHLIICHNESISCFSNLSKNEARSFIDKIKIEMENKKKLENDKDFNFFEYVRKYSNEPNVNITNGNIGWITKFDPIDPVFLDNAFNLSINEISIPIETQFGYHIILVHEKRNETLLEFEVVKDQINLTLYQKIAQDKYLDYLSELRNKSVINIYDFKK